MGQDDGLKRRAPYVKTVEQYGLEGKTCIGPECDLPAIAHFMCNTHYYQKRRGNPLTPRRKYTKRDDS